AAALIQSQAGLPLPVIRPMALKTVLGQNRPYLQVEIRAVCLGAGGRCSDGCKQNQDINSVIAHGWGTLHRVLLTGHFMRHFTRNSVPNSSPSFSPVTAGEGTQKRSSPSLVLYIVLGIRH